MGALTRRAALSMTGALAASAAPVAAMANPDPRIADLFREADELERATAWINSAPRTDEELDAFGCEKGDRFFSKVEALPETPEYAAIRARAVSLLYDGARVSLGAETTDVRLAAQIVRSLIPAKGA